MAGLDRSTTSATCPGQTYQTSNVLVFLDNNVWNDLIDHPEGALTVDLLLRAFRSGHMAVVGTLELEEELLGAARRKPAKFRKMRQLYYKLTSSRILLPQRERHNAETLHGGRLPLGQRYLSRSLQRRRRELMTRLGDVLSIGDEVHEKKAKDQAWAVAQREQVRARLKEQGINPDTDMAGWFASADVADWMQAVRDDPRGFPTDAATPMSIATRPTAWLATSYFMARIERTVGANRTIKMSDPHDAEHCAVGAYVDILVTSDQEFAATLAMLPYLPCRVMSPGQLAVMLEDTLGNP